jgi:hypothetical protein
MKKIWLLFAAIFCLVASPVRGQSCDAINGKILTAIYSYQFEKADSLLKEKECNRLESDFLRIQLSRWKNIPVAFSHEKDNYLASLNALKQNASTVQGQNFVKICSQLFLAEAYFTVDRKLNAATELYETYPLFIDSFNDSSRIRSVFIQGLYLYFAEHFSDQSRSFQLVSGILKPGNKTEGLARIHQAAFADPLVGIEAAIYEAHILLHIENRYSEALVISKRLVDEYPENLKFIEMYAECLLALKQYEACAQNAKRLLNSENKFYHCAAYLFNGIIEEEFDGNARAALKSYETCIKVGSQYTKLLQYHISKARDRTENLD